MAFVIVQHLDPTHKGIMAELLQRATGMKVIQVKDRTRVRPNCVYVIPPNKDMSILHGVLHLLAPAAPRGLRLPIDFFLRSLAQDRQERSIGVILSGMGSDGTLGLRAIKEKAGVVLVQEPATAKFDGMPRSAVDAGLADIVAPVDELPGKIIAYLQRTPLIVRTEVALEDKTQSALEKAVILLRAHTGHDFSLYKRNTLYRRIERRMGIHQISQDGRLRPLPAGKLAGAGSALQGAADRGDELLPRSGGLGTVARTGHPGAAREPVARPGAAGVGARLLHRGGGLFPGHRVQGGIGAGQAQGEFRAADLRHRPGPGRDRQGPPGPLSAQHRRRRVAGAADPVLCQRRTRLPGAQRDSRDGDLCAAESHHGSALYQAGHPELPQPADLSGPRRCRRN